MEFRDASDIFLSFLGCKSIVNWILFDKRYFYQALLTLDENDRTNVMFKIKMEIENYYAENYLKNSWHIARINAEKYIMVLPPQIPNTK